MTFLTRLPDAADTTGLPTDPGSAVLAVIPATPTGADPQQLPTRDSDARAGPAPVLRQATLTLQLALAADGSYQLTSPDMPYLALSERDPRRLAQDLGGAIRYEIRRRLTP